MPSNVDIDGKYAKKEGCCQWVIPSDDQQWLLQKKGDVPGRITFLKSLSMSVKGSPISGGEPEKPVLSPRVVGNVTPAPHLV